MGRREAPTRLSAAAAREWQERQRACAGCVYRARFGAGPECAYYCDYLTITGRRRPCPAGAECTVKETAADAARPAAGSGGKERGRVSRKRVDESLTEALERLRAAERALKTLPSCGRVVEL